MAYPGSKRKHVELLRSLELPSAAIVVDGFYGSGGLSAAYRSAYPLSNATIVAGESFEPLRALYSSKYDLKKVASKFIYSVQIYGLSSIWHGLREGLSGEGHCYWEQGEAFLVLNNLSYGNSMRHGNGRHNVQPCSTKVNAMIRRGMLIDPIALRPDLIFDSWSKAIGQSGGANATFLGDPPYQKCSPIYPTDNWIGCAVPPVREAMALNYGVIVMFNNVSEELHRQYEDLAIQNGYSFKAKPTNWLTQFKPTATPSGKEWVWVFKSPEVQS